MEWTIFTRRFFVFFSLVLLIINFALLFWVFQLYRGEAGLIKEQNEQLQKFELLSRNIAWLDVDSFLAMQDFYSLNYSGLRGNLLKQVGGFSNEKGYGIYFQDLNTGASIGINEKEKFLPQSLFKVPLMVAILKKVQEGDISLNSTVYLSKSDFDSNSGTLFQKGEGYALTVKELLEVMIQESDNTAMNALSKNFVNYTDYFEITAIMGLPPSEGGTTTVSPKEYSNLFRSLYYSNYLRRPFSEIALSILAGTEFNEQLSAGIPENVKISHKFGANDNLKYYHDCGIIYLEKKNYILCVMSKGNTREQANSVISNISKTVYEYVSKN